MDVYGMFHQFVLKLVLSLVKKFLLRQCYPDLIAYQTSNALPFSSGGKAICSVNFS